jgi:hypothetical protein
MGETHRWKRAAAIAAVLAAILALARATSCAGGRELIFLAGLAGVLAAIWIDEPARGRGARVALFLIASFMVTIAVLFMILTIFAGSC